MTTSTVASPQAEPVAWASAREAAAVGMTLAFTAQRAPERLAIISDHGSRSFAELNARANQWAHLFRSAGLKAGDAVALMCGNRPEFVEVYAACWRTGIRFTCLNWHLQADEAAYIVRNCEAKVFVADARVADVAAAVKKQVGGRLLWVAVGGAIDGFDPEADVLAGQPTEDLANPCRGNVMLYTSGTTGRPKGVDRPPAPPAPGPERGVPLVRGESLVLCTGPLYHAAPLQINLITPLLQGIGVVLMDRWDAEETLRLIEKHGVTHTHMVATMFHRLLSLPPEVRGRYDLSCLRYVIHGAAPTPVHVKRDLMNWLGPIVYEYYAGTEGGGTFITPDEWLAKPGSVGRANPGRGLMILDEQGRELESGEVGGVYFTVPEEGAFTYFGDEDKTRGAYQGDRFTLGDQGLLDEDGYLFLTGRSSEVIISAGVNIYPAEVDAVLLMHTAVSDAAAVGVPNEERGEEVRAVVALHAEVAATPALADELIQFCRERLAHFKCPRAVDFVADLPRSEAGKVQRRKVRDPYWEGQTRQI